MKEPYLVHSDLTGAIYIVVGNEKYEVTEQAKNAVKAVNGARWIEYSWNDNGLARWGLECDKCHKKYKYGGEIWNNPNFCPNCGAYMIGEVEK